MHHLIDVLKLPRETPNRQRLVDIICCSENAGTMDGVRLAGLDLSGLYLVGANMRGVDFRGACCRGVSFPPLTDCNLDGVDASCALFTRLERCSFRRSLLSKVQFGPIMRQCCFAEASMAFAGIMPNYLSIEDLYGENDFTGADLMRFDAAGCHLVGTCFSRARLTRARLSRANLRGCDLSGANLDDTALTGANLEGVRVNGASLRNCLIGPGQRATWREMERAVIDPPRVAKVQTDAFVAALIQKGDYEVRWEMYRPETMEAVEAWIRKDEEGWRGMMFRVLDSAPLILYSTSESTLPGFAAEIASDYAGWEVREHSVRVECREGETESAICDALPTALREMLATEPF